MKSNRTFSQSGALARCITLLPVILAVLLGIAPAQAEILIPSNEDVGIWDDVNRIYTLTQDVSEVIRIEEGNLTMDGDGHTITITTRNGVYVTDVNGVTIQNVNIQRGGGTKGHVGIRVYRASGLTIQNVTIQNFLRAGIRFNSDYFQPLTDLSISSSTIVGCVKGVELTGEGCPGTNNSFSYLVLEGNDIGIYLYATNGVNVSHCEINSNLIGISDEENADNVFELNNINNNGTAISSDGTSAGKFFSNNFIGNGSLIAGASPAMTFDGNYIDPSPEPCGGCDSPVWCDPLICNYNPASVPIGENQPPVAVCQDVTPLNLTRTVRLP